MASVEIVAPNGQRYQQPTGLFINNEFVPATGGQTITSLDPALVPPRLSPFLSRAIELTPSSTDKPIATVDAASAEDVDRAVQASKAALAHSSWKLLPATERGQLMARLADLLEQNRELLATIDAWDNGKLRSVSPQTIMHKLIEL